MGLLRRPVGFVVSRLVHGGGRALGRGLVLLLMGLMLAGCGDQEWRWNVKVTVVVDTPSGERSGSSVVRVGVRKYSGLQRRLGYAYGAGVLKGEAVVVPLPDGQYLFALVVADDMAYRAAEVVFDDLLPEEDAARYRKMARLRVRREVPRRLYPLLVTFDDINDPKTVQRVDPDDLAAIFGPGYRLKSITIEITDKPVTRGKVEKVLGWWKHVDDYWKELTPAQRDLYIAFEEG